MNWNLSLCIIEFQDRHSDSESVPTVDNSQDWELLEASENATHTRLKVRRLLETCDPNDKIVKVRLTICTM